MVGQASKAQLRRQRGKCEFKASLVYKLQSRAASATQRTKTRRKKKEGKNFQGWA